jgi:hypothetical protein
VLALLTLIVIAADAPEKFMPPVVPVILPPNTGAVSVTVNVFVPQANVPPAPLILNSATLAAPDKVQVPVDNELKLA